MNRVETDFSGESWDWWVVVEICAQLNAFAKKEESSATGIGKDSS